MPQQLQPQTRERDERVGITPQNLSILKTGRAKTGRAKAIRFSTLELLCEVLECQPGDLLSFEKTAPGQESSAHLEEFAEE